MSNSTPPAQGTSKPSQHLDIPDNNLKHQSSLDSTASADSTALPPFPPAGASPDTRSPAHPHQNAEDLLNAAAQHVFPEQPAPQRSPADERKGVTKEGRISPGDRDGSKRAKEGKAREEEPLLGGTPLDEMTPLKTPGILLGGQPGFPFPPKRTASSSTITPAHRQGSGDTLNAVAKGGNIGAIPENEPLQTDLPPMQSESQPDSAATVRRPDLRAHDYGSVCSFLATLEKEEVRADMSLLCFRPPCASTLSTLSYSAWDPHSSSSPAIPSCPQVGADGSFRLDVGS